MSADGDEAGYPAEEELSRRFRIVPAAYVVLRRAEAGRREVLLQFRNGTSYMDKHWACGAAGHVEAAESLWQAAVREAHEELGVTIDPADLIPLTVMQRRHGDAPIDQRVDFFFACDRWTGEPAVQEADKAGELRWFSLDDLPDPVVPHEREVLQALAEGDLPHVMSVGYAD